MKVQQRKM